MLVACSSVFADLIDFRHTSLPFHYRFISQSAGTQPITGLRSEKVTTPRDNKSWCWLISLVSSNWWKDHSAVRESRADQVTRLSLNWNVSVCLSRFSYRHLETHINNINAHFTWKTCPSRKHIQLSCPDRGWCDQVPQGTQLLIPSLGP